MYGTKDVSLRIRNFFTFKETWNVHSTYVPQPAYQTFQ